MRKTLLALILFTINFSAYGESNECNLLSVSTKVDELSESVCNATAFQVVDKLDDEKERFDKMYSGKGSNYQPVLINSVANVESTVAKTNMDLWVTSAFTAIDGKMPIDDVALNQIVQKVFNKDQKDAAEYIKGYITPYLKTGTIKEVNGTNFSPATQTKILNEVFTNPQYASQLGLIKSNVKTALDSLPNNTFLEKDVDLSLEGVKETTALESRRTNSPVDSAYWQEKFTADNPFDETSSESYQVHYQAYLDYKQNIMDRYKDNPEKQKKMNKELESVELSAPKRVSFTPPLGVNINDFYNEIKGKNPYYFNCRIAYSADATAQTKILKDSVTPADKGVKKEEVVSPPPIQASTCNLTSNFGDNGYTITADLQAEIDKCINDIPKDAFNVNIEIESCASTVRTNDEKNLQRSNLVLSQKRTEAIGSLVPKDRGYNVSFDYQGENKMLLESGELKPTGTCGPWVKGVGDHHMNPATCLAGIQKSTDYCTTTPESILKLEGFYWLCNEIDGVPYTDEIKKSLEKYRYNKVKITYELKPIKDKMPEENAFDPSRLPEDKKLAYIESQPHVTCLFPRFTHESWTSYKDRMKHSWIDFTSFVSELHFSLPVGTGESFVSGNGMCSAYH